MTKTIQEIQKENRKLILQAIHGTSYEEALKKEEGSTCHYLYQTERGMIRIMGDIKNYGYNRERHHPNAFLVEIIGNPITLNRVLLALTKINKENKTLDFLIAERGWEEIGGKWFDGYKKCFIARVETIFSCDCCEDFWSDVFVWDLELETLEEQSEETQTKINKILNA